MTATVKRQASATTFSIATALSFVIVLAAGLITPISSVKAETYTLEQCLNLAQKNRASITRAKGAKRDASASVKRQFGRVFLPSLSGSYQTSESRARDQRSEQLSRNGVSDVINTVGGNQLGVFIDTGGVRNIFEVDVADQDRTSSAFRLSANITLFEGFSGLNSYKGVKKNSKRADFDLKRAKQNLDLSVRIAYFAYLANVRNLAVQEEAVKRSQEQLNLVQSRYDVGSASLSDVLKQKVQFGNDNISLLAARNGAKTSKADLGFEVGLDLNENMEFDTSYVEDKFDGALEGAIQSGVTSHPGLRSTELGVDVNRHFLNSAKGGYLPSVTAFVSENWSDGSRSDNLDANLSFSSRSLAFGVNVNWNIFDKFQREQSVTNRRVAYNNAKADSWEARNNVVLAVKKAYFVLDKAVAQVEVSNENVKSAREDMSLAQEKYNLGSASILDMLDAQVSLKDAQVKLIRAKLDQNIAVARLQNAMGVSY